MTVLDRVDWAAAIANAPHYRALGISEVFIDPATAPYHLVTRGKPGVSFRYGTSISYDFYAAHHCGLTLYWWFELEKRNQDFITEGIDSNGVLAVCAKLKNDEVRQGFKYWLAAGAEEIQKQANEYRTQIYRLEADAKLLRLLSMGTGVVFEDDVQ